MSPPAFWAGIRPALTPQVRRLFAGYLGQALGNGMTLSLLVLYLHAVRGIPVGTATTLLALQAVVGLVASPLFGTVVDRVGPRPVVLVSVLLTALGVFVLGQATTVWLAAAAMITMTVGSAGTWGPTSALIAALLPSEHREAAFGLYFMLLNLGLGLGGLIGSTIIDLNDPRTFQTLYTINAISYLAYFAAVASLGRVGTAGPAPPAAAPAQEPAASPTAGGWSEVLRDRALWRFAAAGLIMLTFGYGAIEAGVALFITEHVGLSERLIGVFFACNTAVIVLAQLFVISAIRTRSRTSVLTAAGATWAAAWALIGSALGLASWAAVAVLCLGSAVFALGETLWSPVAPALINDLAPEHLRGRYNAFQSVMWGVSGAFGPLVTGVFLQHDAAALWAGTLAVGCLVGGWLAFGLRGHLTAQQDGLTLAAASGEPA